MQCVYDISDSENRKRKIRIISSGVSSKIISFIVLRSIQNQFHDGNVNVIALAMQFKRYELCFYAK